MSNVCIVAPTYNEAENVPKLVKKLEEILRKEDFKLIIVDDDSSDGTAGIAEKLNTQYGNIVVHKRAGKLGIGSAIREGMEIALSLPDTKFIVTMDADFSHDPQDLPRLLHEAEKSGLVQGSRYVEGGKIVGWGVIRKTISQGANLLCRTLLRTHLKEHTTYYRVYSRECAKIVVKDARRDGYEFAIASILTAKNHGVKITEVPITFVDRTGGESKLKSFDIFKWFFFIMKTFLTQPLKRLE